VPERGAGSVPERGAGSVPERGAGWVYYETVGGGQGARPPRPPSQHEIGIRPDVVGSQSSVSGVAGAGGVDGMSGVHTGMTNSLNTPTEALERSYPMRVRRYRLRRGSGGEGAARGGDGIERDLEVLEDCTLSLITERRLSRPWGLEGGESGAPGENWLLPGGSEADARRLPDKCTVELKSGDVLRVLTPGGGGYGRSRGGGD